MQAKEVKPALLKMLGQAKNITSLEEAFVLHSYVYHIHPFSNGNKRICRILETILLQKV